MNLRIILDYLTRDIPEKHKSIGIHSDSEENQSIAWFFVAPDYAMTQPTEAEISAAETDALAWFADQKIISYDALFKLLPRTIRARANALKDTMKADTDETNKFNGYMLDELLRDVSTGELYNDGDTFQNQEFAGVRTLLVTAGILTQDQADTWGQLQTVE